MGNSYISSCRLSETEAGTTEQAPNPTLLRCSVYSASGDYQMTPKSGDEDSTAYESVVETIDRATRLIKSVSNFIFAVTALLAPFVFGFPYLPWEQIISAGTFIIVFVLLLFQV